MSQADTQHPLVVGLTVVFSCHAEEATLSLLDSHRITSTQGREEINLIVGAVTMASLLPAAAAPSCYLFDVAEVTREVLLEICRRVGEGSSDVYTRRLFEHEAALRSKGMAAVIELLGARADGDTNARQELAENIALGVLDEGQELVEKYRRNYIDSKTIEHASRESGSSIYRQMQDGSITLTDEVWIVRHVSKKQTTFFRLGSRRPAIAPEQATKFSCRDALEVAQNTNCPTTGPWWLRFLSALTRLSGAYAEALPLRKAIEDFRGIQVITLTPKDMMKNLMQEELENAHCETGMTGPALLFVVGYARWIALQEKPIGYRDGNAGPFRQL